MPDQPTPRAVNTVIRAFTPGWQHTLTHTRGPIERTRLGPPRGDGTRPRETYVDPDVPSVLLVAKHPAARRGLVALWTGKPDGGYAFSTAVRGRHDNEHSPRTLTATELKAYAAADPFAELDDVDEVAA